MSISKPRALYIISLVILGVLLGFTALRPMTAVGQYSEVLQEELLQSENGWTFQCIIANNEGSDTSYTIEIMVDGRPYQQTVTIREGATFTYAQSILCSSIDEGNVSFSIYKEGEDSPFEQTNYSLR